MAWNSSPKVAAARDFAKKFNKKQVIIISLNDDTMEYSSYGETKQLCAETKHLANIAYDAIWDELSK